MPIVLKSERELVKMRAAGRVVGECHLLLRDAIKPGITTAALDELVRGHLSRSGARSPFLGYTMGGTAPPFPGAVCASINEVVVHGIPGPARLREGDIISIDVGAVLDGYVGDSAWTYAVGEIAPQAGRLLDVTEACLWRALDQARAGNRLGDIGAAIQQHAEGSGYAVIRDLYSHGVGRKLHEEPSAIPNYGRSGTGLRLRPGMTLAIEPMVAAGGAGIAERDDGWTIASEDGTLTAHFEHTIAIMPDGGPEILTRVV